MSADPKRDAEDIAYKLKNSGLKNPMMVADYLHRLGERCFDEAHSLEKMALGHARTATAPPPWPPSAADASWKQMLEFLKIGDEMRELGACLRTQEQIARAEAMRWAEK